MGAGLQRVARMCGGIVAKDSKRAVVHKWDEEKGETLIEREMSREDYDREQEAKGQAGPRR